MKPGRVDASQLPALEGEVAHPEIPDHQMVRRIGRGSYGEVWLARSAVGTNRAVKVVYRERFEDSRPYEREFSGIKKYEPISRSNEGLVDVLQIGRNDGAGYFYYIMELADAAEPLGEYVPRTLAWEIRKRVRLPLGECFTLGLSLNMALGHLHRKGLIHRDVKPSNIIFVSGVAKLADIGLVTDLAEAQSFVGTDGFIPPEGPNSAQADIYALGKVLYEAAMGKDRREFPEPCSGLGVDPESRQLMELNAVVLKACAHHPKERYQSAEEMNADLALLHSGQSVRQKHFMARRLRITKRVLVGALTVMVLGVVPYALAIKEARLARAARADADERLWLSLLHEAKAWRLGGEVGRRAAALKALQRAAAIHPSLGLRNETIACLALSDVREEDHWHPAFRNGEYEALDDSFERYALLNEADGTLTIRRARDDFELQRLPRFSMPAFDSAESLQRNLLKFSPNGRWLSLPHGIDPAVLELWDLQRGVMTTNFPGHKCRVLAYSADSRLVAMAFFEGRDTNSPVVIYDLEEQRALSSIEHGTVPCNISFHPSARRLATSSEQSTEVRIFDLDSAAITQVLPHPRAIAPICWSPDGRLLAAGCADNQVYLWQAEGTNLVHILPGHSGWPRELSFGLNGQLLASRGWDGTLRFWDPWTGHLLFFERVIGMTRGFDRTGLNYAYKGADGELKNLELQPSKECRLLRTGTSFQGRGQNCDFSPDSKWFLTVHEDGVRLWDPAGGQLFGFLPLVGVERAVFFHGNGDVLMATGRGMIERSLTPDPATHTLQQTRERILTGPNAEEFSIGGHGNRVAATAGANLWLLELPTGAVKQINVGLGETGRGRTTLHPALNRDETLLACGADSTGNELLPVKVFSVATGKCVWQSSPRGANGTRPQFSPDGKWLVLGDDCEYTLLEVDGWRPVHRFSRGNAGYGAFMAFSSTGTVLALALTRDLVQLVDVVTGRELATLEAPEAYDIYHIAFSPDGDRLAVMYRNGPVHLWDLGLIRAELEQMGLNWLAPASPGVATSTTAARLARATSSQSAERSR